MAKQILYRNPGGGGCVPYALANMLEVAPSTLPLPRLSGYSFADAAYMINQVKTISKHLGDRVQYGLDVVFRASYNRLDVQTINRLLQTELPEGKKLFGLIETILVNGERHMSGVWLSTSPEQGFELVDANENQTHLLQYGSLRPRALALLVVVGGDGSSVCLFD